MIRIGLITFHSSNNFGSVLQAYGLYRAVRDFGVDIKIIDYTCEKNFNNEIPHFPKLTINPYNCLLGVARWIISPKRKRYIELQKFLRKHAQLTRRLERSELKKLSSEFDLFLIGSDMVWEMDLNGGDLTYFLDFENNPSKKIAFASSVGFPWNDKEKGIIKPLLSQFKHIAVRETASANWIEELIGTRSPVVCDPTMLLTREEWITFVSNKRPEEKYVLTYFETDNGDCLDSAIKIAAKNKIKVKRIDVGTKRATEYEVIRPTSIQEFLSLIYYAEAVVTASYHGILFSLYFNKPLVFYLRRQTSRVETLLEKLEIGNCDGRFVDINNLPKIDYEKINIGIEDYRKESLRYLKRFIED